MRFPALLALALALAACASQPQNRASDVLPGEQSTTASARHILNTVGTPVHAVIKGVSCAVVGVAAVPLASAFQITGTPQDHELQDDTYKTVGRTCGGSYELGAPPPEVPPSQ